MILITGWKLHTRPAGHENTKKAFALCELQQRLSAEQKKKQTIDELKQAKHWYQVFEQLVAIV